jgi:hypothetical protein
MEKKCETYYIAGPMRAKPKLNFPQFDEVRDALKSRGFNVISPADIDREFGITDDILPDSVEQCQEFCDNVDTRDVARRDLLSIIDDCDGIVMLPEWDISKGAIAEKSVAEWLGLKVILAKEDFHGNWHFLQVDVPTTNNLEKQEELW